MTDIKHTIPDAIKALEEAKRSIPEIETKFVKPVCVINTRIDNALAGLKALQDAVPNAPDVGHIDDWVEYRNKAAKLLAEATEERDGR